MRIARFAMIALLTVTMVLIGAAMIDAVASAQPDAWTQILTQ